MKSGGIIDYSATVQPPSNIRSKLKRLGLDAETLEREGKLELWDYYTLTLGKKSSEKLATNSLKVADFSIEFIKTEIGDPSRPARLGIRDGMSTLARFDDEKTWVEFELTRPIQLAGLHKSVGIRGVVRGLHSDWAYRRLEDAYDGIIDFKLDETSDPPRNLIRSMRDDGFDGRWHQLKMAENLEISFADS